MKVETLSARVSSFSFSIHSVLRACLAGSWLCCCAARSAAISAAVRGVCIGVSVLGVACGSRVGFSPFVCSLTWGSLVSGPGLVSEADEEDEVDRVTRRRLGSGVGLLLVILGVLGALVCLFGGLCFGEWRVWVSVMGRVCALVALCWWRGACLAWRGVVLAWRGACLAWRGAVVACRGVVVVRRGGWAIWQVQ